METSILSFSVPRQNADRLARMGLASSDDNTNISHIGVRVTPTAVRFSATNGRILASLLIPIDDFVGTPTDLILDQAQLAAAVKAAAKGSGRIGFKIDEAEARVTSGTVASVVRRVAGTWPQVDHVWTRPAGRRWVPTMSSIDPLLAAIAQKITGAKTAVLFSSPVDPGSRLERLWAVPGAQPDESVSVSALRAAVTAPAYWSDGFELSILIMPITRSESERQLNLDAHAMPLPPPAARRPGGLIIVHPYIVPVGLAGGAGSSMHTIDLFSDILPDLTPKPTPISAVVDQVATTITKEPSHHPEGRQPSRARHYRDFSGYVPFEPYLLA